MRKIMVYFKTGKESYVSILQQSLLPFLGCGQWEADARRYEDSPTNCPKPGRPEGATYLMSTRGRAGLVEGQYFGETSFMDCNLQIIKTIIASSLILVGIFLIYPLILVGIFLIYPLILVSKFVVSCYNSTCGEF